MAAPPRPGLKTRLASVWPIGELTGWAGPSGFGSRSSAAEVLASEDLSGRVYIVTGANSGLGKATARALACAGARVVLACRSGERGAAAAADIAAASELAGGAASAMVCDLAALASVRAFAQAFADTGLPLHGLICNAGIMPAPYAKTVDGHESTWQINYLAHCLLTDLLLPLLERTAKGPGDARVVYVSSIVHHLGYSGGIRWDAVDEPQGYVPWKAYSQSKLALILHARALNVELAARGSLLAVHAVHPGAVPTDGVEAAEAHSGAAGSCLSALGGRFHRTVAQGAASVVYAVASPQCATPGRGCFVCNANRADGHASRLARDALTAFRLSDLGRSMTTGAERDEAAAAPPAEERAALPTSTAAGEAAA